MKSTVLRALGFVAVMGVVSAASTFDGRPGADGGAWIFNLVAALYVTFMIMTWQQLALSVALYVMAMIVDSQASLYVLTSPKAGESVVFPLGAGVVLMGMLSLVLGVRNRVRVDLSTRC